MFTYKNSGIHLKKKKKDSPYIYRELCLAFSFINVYSLMVIL